MLIEMIQHPVGQGGLFSGKVDSGGGRVNWIYDCGAMYGQLDLDREIEKVSREGSIDILFLSHLHIDHVSGVDKLLKKCSVNTVIMPYFGFRSRFNVMMTYLLNLRIGDGDEDADEVYIRFLRGTSSWLYERGVRRLVRVRYSERYIDPDGLPEIDDRSVGEDEYFERDDDEYRQEARRMKDEEKDDQLNIILSWEGQESSLTEIPDKMSCEIIDVPEDATLEVVSSKYGKVLSLIPYAYRPDKKYIDDFWEKVTKKLGYDKISKIFRSESYEDSDHSENVKNIWRIVKICFEDFPVGQNEISMSLYCGPKSNSKIYIKKR